MADVVAFVADGMVTGSSFCICLLYYVKFIYFILLHCLFVFILHLFAFYFIFSSELLTEPHPKHVADGICIHFYLGMDC